MAQVKVSNPSPLPPSLHIVPQALSPCPTLPKDALRSSSSPHPPSPSLPPHPPHPQSYPAWKKNVRGWKTLFNCGKKPRRVSVGEEAIFVHPLTSKRQQPKAINFVELTSLNMTLEEEFLPLSDDRDRSASTGVAKVLVSRKGGPDFVLTMDGVEAKAFVESVSSRFLLATPPVTPPPSPPRVATTAAAVALPPVLVGPIEPIVEQAPVLPAAAPAVLPAFPLTEPHHTLVQGGEEGQSWKGLYFLLCILAFLRVGLTLFTGDNIVSAIGIFASILNAPIALFKALSSVLSAPTAGTTTTAALLSLLGEHCSVFSILGGMGLSAITSFIIHALAEKSNNQASAASSWMRAIAAPVAGLVAFVHACVLVCQIVAYPGPQMMKMALTLLLLTLALKQWTFVATSAEFRLKAFLTGQSSSGVTLGSYIYSLFAPTLIYQISYPRAASINWLRVLSLLAQQVMILIVSGVLLQDWISPLLDLYKHAVTKEDIWQIALATLRLAVPSTLVWLVLIGYGLFHVHLNMVAELTRFGDRLFFRDWWNARTLKYYWSNWNLPVSCFLRRHVMYPLKRAGCPYFLSMYAVFFVSAVLHEVGVAVPFGTYQGYRGFLRLYGLWAFWGMIGQLGAIQMTNMFEKRPQWMGNLAFWTMFCVVGQPLAVLLYHNEVTVILPQLAAGAAGLA